MAGSSFSLCSLEGACCEPWVLRRSCIYLLHNNSGKSSLTLISVSLCLPGTPLYLSGHKRQELSSFSPRHLPLLGSSEALFFPSHSNWKKAPLAFPSHHSVASKCGFSWSGGERKKASIVFRGFLPSHGAAIQPCETILRKNKVFKSKLSPGPWSKFGFCYFSFKYYVYYLFILFICVHACTCAQGPQRLQDGTGSPGIGLSSSCQLPCVVAGN